MSDTPKTDEQINGKPCTRFAILDGDSLRYALVASEFARQLERELNAANDRIKQLEEFVRSCADNFDCDHDSHKWSTQCRACDAQILIDAKEAKP